MPSYVYNNLPPPASCYQTPFKQQYQQPAAYHSQNQNQNQHQTYQNQPSSYGFQNHSAPNYERPLSPVPITYNLTAQYELFSDHILALYHQDSHEKYYRWSDEDIACDLANRSFVNGVSMDSGPDLATHAVEINFLLVRKGVWRFCVERAERIREKVMASM